MTPSPYITLIFPAFNEAKTIVGTIQESAAYFSSRGMTYEIIVAADGEDGTRELVRRQFAGDDRIVVVGHKDRLGKGRGIREAVALARGSIVGYADADNKVPIDDYDKLDPWFGQGFDVVLGSRGMQQSKVERPQPWYRRIGSRGFAIVMHAMSGLHQITDSQCGFKFFRRDVAKDIFSRQMIDGYMFDVEILILAQRAGCRVQQVPIRWRDDGDSRLQLLRGNLQNMRDLWRIRSRWGKS